MSKIKIRPSTPGQVFVSRFKDRPEIKERLRTMQFAPELIEGLCKDELIITPEIAAGLAVATQTTPHFWLNLQNNWELSKLNYSNLKNINPVAA